jgi:hypothetical protein
MFGRRKPEIAPAPPPPPPEPAIPSRWPRNHKTNARVSRAKIYKHSSSNYAHLVVMVDDPDETSEEKILALTFDVSSHPPLATVEEGDRLSLELYKHTETAAWNISKGRILFDPDKERARFESKSQPTAER